MLPQGSKIQYALSSEEGYQRVPFDVKLTFLTAMLLFYPVALCFLQDSYPSVEYWFGTTMFWIGIAIVIWTLVFHFLLARRAISRNSGALFMIVVPSAVLVIATQYQAFYFKNIQAMLMANDCSLPRKLALQESWNGANTFFQNCVLTYANKTGSNIAATRLVTPIDSCPGYEQAIEGNKRNWHYLADMEHEHHCGGWCTSALPIWTKEQFPQDSCSLTAARLFSSSISRAGLQIAVYSAILLLFTSLVLLLAPSLLGAGPS